MVRDRFTLNFAQTILGNGSNPRELQRDFIPNFARTTFSSDSDIQMASRQVLIETLPHHERQQQETWEQDQLNYNHDKCSAGYAWVRINGGYKCAGGFHLVTDELLAEGKGGYYEKNLVRSKYWEIPWEQVDWIGPRYRIPKVDNGHDMRYPVRIGSPTVGVIGHKDRVNAERGRR